MALLTDLLKTPLGGLRANSGVDWNKVKLNVASAPKVTVATPTAPTTLKVMNTGATPRQSWQGVPTQISNQGRANEDLSRSWNSAPTPTPFDPAADIPWTQQGTIARSSVLSRTPATTSAAQSQGGLLNMPLGGASGVKLPPSAMSSQMAPQNMLNTPLGGGPSAAPVSTPPIAPVSTPPAATPTATPADGFAPPTSQGGFTGRWLASGTGRPPSYVGMYRDTIPEEYWDEWQAENDAYVASGQYSPQPIGRDQNGNIIWSTPPNARYSTSNPDLNPTGQPPGVRIGQPGVPSFSNLPGGNYTQAPGQTPPTNPAIPGVGSTPPGFGNLPIGQPHPGATPIPNTPIPPGTTPPGTTPPGTTPPAQIPGTTPALPSTITPPALPTAAPQAQMDDYVPERVEAPQVSETLANLLSGDNPYVKRALEQAQAQGAQMANQRGLLNSSLAGSLAQEQFLNQIVPIALADTEIQAQFARDEAQFGRDKALAMLQRDISKELAQQGFDFGRYTQDRAAQLEQMLSRQGFEQERELQGREFGQEQLLQGRDIEAERARIDQQYRNTSQLAQQEFTQKEQLIEQEYGLRATLHDTMSRIDLGNQMRTGFLSSISGVQDTYIRELAAIQQAEGLTPEQKGEAMQIAADAYNQHFNFIADAFQYVSGIDFDFLPDA